MRLKIGDLIPISGDDYLTFMLTPNDVKISKVIDNIGNVVTNKHASIIMANSEVAMSAVLNSEIALSAVLNSEVAMSSVADSEVAMSMVANSTAIMNLVINSPVALSAVLNSEVSLNKLFNSLIAKTAMFGVNRVTSAIANNQLAIDWLTKNVAIEYSTIAEGTSVIYNGKALLLEFWAASSADYISHGFSVKVGNVGDNSMKPISGVKSKNVMACSPFRLTRTVSSGYKTYCTYVIMDK